MPTASIAPTALRRQAKAIPARRSWRQILRARFLTRARRRRGRLGHGPGGGPAGRSCRRPRRRKSAAAGLAHISLAISGLHIGMVTGALFFLVRLLGAWVSGAQLCACPCTPDCGRRRGSDRRLSLLHHLRWLGADPARNDRGRPRHGRHPAVARRPVFAAVGVGFARAAACAAGSSPRRW